MICSNLKIIQRVLILKLVDPKKRKVFQHSLSIEP